MTREALYICARCDSQYQKWQGQCDECNAWGTIAQQSDNSEAGAHIETIPATDVSLAAVGRFPVGMREIDSVLGGGLVEGSLTLLAGEPGIGKSTLVLHIAQGMLRAGGSVLYVCGEESPQQISERLDRLNVDKTKLLFLPRAGVVSIMSAIKKEKPSLLIVDSVQTAYHEQQEGEPGSIVQVRSVTGTLLQLAKETGVPVVLIGHVTKEGTVAGPRLLEHMVDVVLSLEGDRFHEHRLLRSVKNRFGPTNYVGVFSMASEGLSEVENPSALFLDAHTSSPGSVVSAIMEGNRPFLVEIQALTQKTSFGYPKRTVSGFDANRLEVLLAVLSKRAGLKLDDQDVFINMVGGLKSKDPALDLAVSLAVVSSLTSQTLPEQMLVLGEVGLGGEVRNVSYVEQRIAEASRLGFTSFMAPKSSHQQSIVVHTIREALSAIQITV